jgi:hypothetical protein
MPRPCRIAILSDIHYAGPAERLRGNDYEYRDLQSPIQRRFCHYYRYHFWLRNPLDHGHLLDAFLEQAGDVDHVFALGDYSCDSAFVGVSDDAALESAAECLRKLRQRYGDRLHTLIGDHELGKFPMFGKRGGLRFKSWDRVLGELALKPCWRVDLGHTVCVGVTSTLLMLPAYTREALPEELPSWEAARKAHFDEIASVFDSIPVDQSILLFCHDPSALPYLLESSAVRERLPRIQLTFVGHLHSPFILRQSRILAGMPAIHFLGHTVQRLSKALARARHWQPFHVHLCPALAGIELLKDGGFYRMEVDSEGAGPPRLTREYLPR